jgi:hypothetical protein
MRRDIVHPGADRLKYEIREIVAFAQELGRWNIPIVWENIGDPVKKGEPVAPWIKEIVGRKAAEDLSYAYTETEGAREARGFLADRANARPRTAGGPEPARLDPRDVLFFNGLGDAVAKVFGFLRREARVLGPPPPTPPSPPRGGPLRLRALTYRLDPARLDARHGGCGAQGQVQRLHRRHPPDKSG